MFTFRFVREVESNGAGVNNAKININDLIESSLYAAYIFNFSGRQKHRLTRKLTSVAAASASGSSAIVS